MKASLSTILIVAGLLLSGCILSLAFAARWRDSVAANALSVRDYDSVMAQARDSEERSRRLEKEGEAKFTYQLTVSAREDLPRRLIAAVEEAGLRASGARDITDKRAELAVSGSHVNALRFFFTVERDFPELRLRGCAWTAQSDGSVAITATWDIWQIPKPTP